MLQESVISFNPHDKLPSLAPSYRSRNRDTERVRSLPQGTHLGFEPRQLDSRGLVLDCPPHRHTKLFKYFWHPKVDEMPSQAVPANTMREYFLKHTNWAPTMCQLPGQALRSVSSWSGAGTDCNREVEVQGTMTGTGTKHEKHWGRHPNHSWGVERGQGKRAPRSSLLPSHPVWGQQSKGVSCCTKHPPTPGLYCKQEGN